MRRFWLECRRIEDSAFSSVAGERVLIPSLKLEGAIVREVGYNVAAIEVDGEVYHWEPGGEVPAFDQLVKMVGQL